MGGRLLDYIAQGDSGDLPLAADMPARIAVGGASIYYEQDTGNFRFFNASTVAWDTWTTQTTEAIQDMIAAFLVQSTGISIVYDDALNTLTFSSTVTQYTDEMAQDAIAALIAAGVDTGIAIVYNDVGNLIGFTVNVAADTDIWGGTSDTKFITPKRLKDWRTPVALVDGATITPDGATGVNFYVTLGGNRILANPTNFNPGQFGVIHVTQDGTGTRTLAFGANWKFGSTSIAGNVLSVAAGATDAIHYYVRADGTITSFIVQNLTGSPTRLKLDNLSNVNMTTPPTDGQILTYDNATGKWKPATSAGGGFGTVDMSAYGITGGPLSAPTESSSSEFGYWLNHAVSNITTNNFWFRTRAFSGNLTLLAKILMSIQSNGNSSIGVVFRESGATKFVGLMSTYNAGTYCEVTKSTNDGSTSSAPVGATSHTLSTGQVPAYLRCVYVAGTNTLTMSVSIDGMSWVQLYTGTTDVTPNQVGVLLRVWSSTGPLPIQGTFKYFSDSGNGVKWNLP
jgi:hypothetical protein